MYQFMMTDAVGVAAPGINVDIVPGETLVLVLPDNGARALLLHRMAGLSEHGLSDWQGIAPAISHMLSQPLLLPWRSVQENMRLVNDDEKLIHEVLTLTGLLEARDDRSSHLPPAVLRRAALARCLLSVPDVVVMDDPVFDLMEEHASTLRGLLRELIADHPERTLIYGTACFDEACRMGGRVLMLSDYPLAIEREMFDPTPLELLA